MAKVTPNASAKPAAKDSKKEKKVKVELPKYPAVGSKDPNIYPFKEVPTDFSFTKHASLEKGDFAKKSTYMLYKAAEYDARAAEYRERAKTADQKGGGKANRLVKMLAKAADLRAELAAAGIDVDALLAQTKPAAAPAGAEQPKA